MTGTYADLTWVRAYVMAQQPLALSAEPYDLTARLEALAGKAPDGTKVYRPDLYCARYLDKQSGLSSARGGTTFRYDTQVVAYLKAQAELDAAYSLTVPPGTEALPQTLPQPYSGSIRTTVVF